MVRQGQKGFPRKNFENPRFAKGQQPTNEMRLSLDISNTNLRETHYNLHGIDTITINEAIGLLSHDELEMLASGLKERIVIRTGRKTITLI